MAVPADLKYSRSHEWVKVEGDTALVGITDHAQAELGDITYLELPETGRILAEDEIFGTVESVKAVSDLYSPLSGEVIEVNTEITDAAETINQDAYGAGWMIRIKLTNPAELDHLLSADQYDQMIRE
jgi:glycine cleavage system H protein